MVEEAVVVVLVLQRHDLALDERIEHFLELAQGKLAHMLQAQHELLGLLLGHHGNRTLGDVLAEIADALDTPLRSLNREWSVARAWLRRELS